MELPITPTLTVIFRHGVSLTSEIKEDKTL